MQFSSAFNRNYPGDRWLWMIIAVNVAAIAAVIFAFSGCGLYTQQSPLPSAVNMKADCAKAPGSLSCDVYPILSGICDGNIALPIMVGNFDQAICVGLGYRLVAGTSLKLAGK